MGRQQAQAQAQIMVLLEIWRGPLEELPKDFRQEQDSDQGEFKLAQIAFSFAGITQRIGHGSPIFFSM